MNVTFTGVINSDDFEVVLDGLRRWLGEPGLQGRERLSGEQVTFEDARVALICSRSFGSRGVGHDFLIEGTVFDDLDPALRFLAALRQAYVGSGVTAELEYGEMDADGMPTGEGLELP
ncbi:MAG TPA: hypothetical protein VFE41_16420 [Acetobacteraceae bacterium]|jgi:hypothetical protein|nr:hypothetical protein [Acetobacteraceae bacterium]